jgi:hypothetical protein
VVGTFSLRGFISRTFVTARRAVTHAPLRLRILLALLAVVIAGAAVWTIRTWRFERQLVSVMEEIVADFNLQSPLRFGEEPSADTTYKIVCSSKYLVVGPVTGKIMFFITPKCNTEHASAEARLACLICSGRTTHQLDYIYLRGRDGWEFQDSYMWRHGSP